MFQRQINWISSGCLLVYINTFVEVTQVFYHDLKAQQCYHRSNSLWVSAFASHHFTLPIGSIRCLYPTVPGVPQIGIKMAIIILYFIFSHHSILFQGRKTSSNLLEKTENFLFPRILYKILLISHCPDRIIGLVLGEKIHFGQDLSLLIICSK